MKKGTFISSWARIGASGQKTAAEKDECPLFCRGGRRWAGILLVGFSAVTGLLAIPFLVRAEIRWAEMNAFLLAGTLALAAAVLCHGAAALSLRNAATFLAVSFVLSLAAEYASIRWAVPFGETYRYHGDLRPRLLGAVPLFIPLAWAVLAYGPVVLLRPLPTRAGGRPSGRRIFVKAGLGGLYLMALDLFLDPLAVSVGAWTWARPGRHFGIPLQNFAGWWVVGIAIYACYFLLERPGPTMRRSGRRALDWTFMIGSAGFIVLTVPPLLTHVGSILPMALAGPVMAPFWVYWFIAVGARPRSDLARTPAARHSGDGSAPSGHRP